MIELNIRFQPRQLGLWKVIVDVLRTAVMLTYGGSRGGGKSGGIRRILIALLTQHPGTSALLLRTTEDQVKKNHVLQLWMEFPELEQYYRDGILFLPNGSTLHFGYAKNPGDIRRYQGQGFEWVAADDCGDWDPEDLSWLRTIARTTKVGIRPCVILTPNPGGRAHSWFKRLFFDRDFQPGEDPEDFLPLIPAFGWDNGEWVRGELRDAGFSLRDYNAWPEEKRREWFLRSAYGKSLLGMPKHQQRAHLWGDWQAFAGQFFDFWGPHLLKPVPELPKWWARWVAIDWGFDHASVAHWFCTDGKTTWIYREHMVSDRHPVDLASDIATLSKGETIDAIYLSHDAFGRHDSERTIAHEMADVFFEAKLPEPEKADTDRKGGWLLMYHGFRDGSVVVTDRCPALVKCIALLIRDPDCDGDVLKVDGDDAADACRYGLKTRRRTSHAKPREQRLRELVTSKDPNEMHMQHLAALEKLRGEGDGNSFTHSRIRRRHAA